MRGAARGARERSLTPKPTSRFRNHPARHTIWPLASPYTPKPPPHPQVDLSNRRLGDADCLRLVHAMASAEIPVQELSLAGNPRLTEASIGPLLEALCAGGCTVEYLDLSGSLQVPAVIGGARGTGSTRGAGGGQGARGTGSTRAARGIRRVKGARAAGSTMGCWGSQ